MFSKRMSSALAAALGGDEGDWAARGGSNWDVLASFDVISALTSDDFREERVTDAGWRANDFAGDSFIVLAQAVRGNGGIDTVGNSRRDFNGPDKFAVFEPKSFAGGLLRAFFLGL